MSPFDSLARRLGHTGLRRTVLATAMALLMAGTGLAALTLQPQSTPWSSGIQGRQTVIVPDDADGDGLPDALENRIGSDPHNFSTLGQGVPDGWIHHWFGSSVDWNRSDTLAAPALSPPLEQLPIDLRSPGLTPPTLVEVYAADDARHEEANVRGAWWLARPSLDPRQWDNGGDGIADAWLLQYGIHPLDADPDRAAPGDPLLTLREKYESGLDPTRSDTDGDGLPDASERSGQTRFGQAEHRFRPTDPRAFSSRGDGVADGYLVRFGLDPHDENVAEASPAGDGITVREKFEVTRDHCLAAAPDGCDWVRRLRDGPLLDPTAWDSLGDGVPDAWSMRDPHGRAHPLEDASATVAYSSEAWDSTPWSGTADDLVGVVVDDQNPPPEEPFQVTLRDLYKYQRPEGWSEARDGPWWGGLPTMIETPEGGLPPAVALRGWSLGVDASLGTGGEDAGSDLDVVRASADPRSNDTDGDGLTDLQEYFGVLPDGQAFPRTDPGDPDTDGDGLDDRTEVHPDGARTDPRRRDTSGSFLTDGQEWAYWNERFDTAMKLVLADPDDARQQLDWLSSGGQDILQEVRRLLPAGDLDGDGIRNILDADADGDGLKDGAELLPNQFLDLPTQRARPSTDPARADSDGDGLPDAWEVSWSLDQYYNCRNGCRAPVAGDLGGWPIDPSRPASWVELGLDKPDAEVGLAADRLALPDGPQVEFVNRMAYEYDLVPFRTHADRHDTDGDGVPDMFAIHWGVENVPDWAVEELRTKEWHRQAAARISKTLSDRGRLVDLDAVAFDPGTSEVEDPLGLESNLLGMFSPQKREKGTWRLAEPGDFVGGPNECDTTDADTSSFLPGASHPRREVEYQDTDPDQGIPDRVLDPLEKLCWIWVPHPVGVDVVEGTSPWSHDSDGDRLPDTWESLYRGQRSDLSPNDITPGSRKGQPGGCDDATVGGKAEFCFTYLDAYTLGLHPDRSDADGGGLADWVEVHLLELDPRDPFDDSGEEDWDGDGILNWIEDTLGTDRMEPDTDGDGLLDGDLDGTLQDPDERLFLRDDRGAGNLCVPGPGHDDFDAPVPNMESRPDKFGGPLTHSQLVDLYRSRGILHEETSQSCPADHILFKREGVKDTKNNLVKPDGTVTDSRRWDTSGDGVPDGWVVHWRDRTSDGNAQKTLNPSKDLTACGDADKTCSKDTDRDFLHAHLEYLLHRPAPPGWPSMWDEARDGPWWGGSDPARADTDGDAPWWPRSQDANDLADPDLDNDGIPDALDPWLLDPHNGGPDGSDWIVRWNDTAKRYDTNYSRLWPALQDRAGTHRLDADGDRVPNFLDRARIRVELDEPAVEEVRKEGEAFLLTGCVTVDEPEPDTIPGKLGSYTGAAGNGAAVESVSVKAVLRSLAREEVVGIGFTDGDGCFRIDAHVSSEVETGSAPGRPLVAGEGASVMGRFVPAGSVAKIPSGATTLDPGPVRIAVVAEPNDPQRQPLSFHDNGIRHASVEAFKQRPFSWLPGDQEVQGSQKVPAQAFAVKQDGSGPDFNLDAARHGTAAVFATESGEYPVILLAPTRIEVLPVAGSVRTGEPFNVTGSFADASGNPLRDQTIHVSISTHGRGGEPATRTHTTDADGRFRFSYSPAQTLAMGVGPVTATLTVPSPSGFLDEPEPAAATLVLGEDLEWTGVRVVQDDEEHSGVPMRVAADLPVSIRMRLVDHNDLPAADRDVHVALTGTQQGVVQSRNDLETNETGWVEYILDPLQDNTLELLRLRTHAPASGSGQAEALHEALLQPRFRTFLAGLSDVSGDAGDDVVATGRLLLADGTPVADPSARLVAWSANETHVFNGTGADGGFTLVFQADQPRQQDWKVRFLASGDADDPGFLESSESVGITVTHLGSPQIHLEDPATVRGREAMLEGRLTVAGSPLSGAIVRGGWTDDGKNSTATDEDGGFLLPLAMRNESETATLHARYNGSAIHHAVEAHLDVAVQEPIRLQLRGHSVDGAVPGSTAVEGHLLDGRNESLRGRQVVLDVTDPAGNQARHTALTGADGRLHVPGTSLPLDLPGHYNVEASYQGATFETTAHNATGFNVTHHITARIDHVSGEVHPGSMVRLQGHFNPTSGHLEPLTLAIRFGPTEVSRLTVPSNQPWNVTFPAPLLARGSYPVHVHPLPTQSHVLGQADQVNVTLASPVHVAVEHVPSEGGADAVVQATLDGGTPLEGLEIVLVRRNNAGDVVWLEAAKTDQSGRITVPLDGPGDNVEVMALRDPELRLQTVVYDAEAISYSTTRDGHAMWPLIAASVALLLAAAGTATYIVWVQKRRQSLADVFEEAHQALLDPAASPAEIVRRAYQRLLQILAGTGYHPGEQATVRDIARHSVRAAGLPPAPMQQVSGLFELATYSDQELEPIHRDTALRAFQTLKGALEPRNATRRGRKII